MRSFHDAVSNLKLVYILVLGLYLVENRPHNYTEVFLRTYKQDVG